MKINYGNIYSGCIDIHSFAVDVLDDIVHL